MEWLADTTNSACFSGHCHHRTREHCTRCQLGLSGKEPNRRSQSGAAATTTLMPGPTPRYWFRAEDAEEHGGSKNLSPTLRYSATSSFAKATARRVCAGNLRGIARNRMSAMQRSQRRILSDLSFLRDLLFNLFSRPLCSFQMDR